MIAPNKDPMGTAISEYYHTGKARKLVVQSSCFDDDEIPVPHLFRSYEKMPPLERQALDLTQGKTLDVGAGAGCHALYLQEKGVDVKAIDISTLSCNVMRERGIKNVECVDFFDEKLEGEYETILMLMNGTGIIGKVNNLPNFFKALERHLASGGALFIDSSDLCYLYEDEEGFIELPEDEYYGEIDYCMKYKGIKGEPFDWLYLDYETLEVAAANAGFHCEKIMDGKHYDYLAKITKG